MQIRPALLHHKFLIVCFKPVKSFAVSFVCALNIQTINSTLLHNNSSPTNFIHNYFNAFVSKNQGNMLLCTVNKNAER